jgi:uncharacterized protein (TIGR02099 family)
VPRIAEFRPFMEQQASKALGAPVRIGAVTAASNGLIPSFELRDVTVLDLQGREALRLPRIMAALSPRSVLSLGFEQLYVDGLALDVRRDADARVWVAGFAVSPSEQADSPIVEWIFSQPELVIRHGTVTWTDALRDAPALVLTDVDWVLRNRHLSHSMRLDASPPAQWGSRFELAGVFKQPLLSTRSGQWQQWTGELYGNFAQVDLALLRRYADLGFDVARGTGPLRAWVDVKQGTWAGITMDLALSNVQLTVDPALEPLALRSVSGRLGARKRETGVEFSTEALQFNTQDGLHWPGGNIRVALLDGDNKTPPRGELTADRLDLAALAQIANRLPLGAGLHAALADYVPAGLVERVQATWQGPVEKISQFAAKGRVVGLTLAANATESHARPGIKGANIDFDFDQGGGKALLALRGGSIALPGFFDEPTIAFDQLSGDLQWSVDGARIRINVPQLRFSNVDAQGELQLKWQSGDTSLSLGTIDVQGNLSRADATRVHRYLPLPMPKDARDYVRDAVKTGSASHVKFKVKGPLQDFPFESARQGDFYVSASLKDVTFAYVPSSLMPAGSLPWPAVTQADGELVIDRSVLRTTLSKASLEGAAELRIAKAQGQITDLYENAQVSVSAEARGPLMEGIGVVNRSPIGAMISNALAHATATGMADYRFKLTLPLAAVQQATVQGTVSLAGNNDIQIAPEVPRLSRLRAAVAFSETGLTVTGGQARALGSDVRIDGGLTTLPEGASAGGRPIPQVLRLQGTATAEGLRQARELGFAARLAEYTSGQTSYAATVGFRAGVPELLVTSNLAGLALNLPAPFAKVADAALPVRLETSAVRASIPSGGGGSAGAALATQDQLQFDMGRLVNVVYVRDVTGPQAQVVRGSIGVGLAADEAAPMPADGVLANVNMDNVDIDAWGQVLSRASGTDLSPSTLATPNGSTNANTQASLTYLPTTLAVRARELTVGGRKLNKVVVGGGREGLLWRANVNASELNGYVEYRQPSGPADGRLYARLARLAIEPAAAQDVENLLDAQPASIPALDIVVEDFELRGKKLGRVEVDAVNLGAGSASSGAAREWRLNRFNITTPEAVLTASGNWADLNAQSVAGPSKSIKERRRTVLKFKLNIADAGEVLKRFGMPGVIRQGRGKIEGQVAWLGSPITLDYPSLGGNFYVNVENGQFLKADPGIAKLLGVLSLQSLPRRLVLDFRDVFSEGFSFDFVRGDVTIDQGMARTNNLQMKGVNAAVLMEGQADIARETQAIRVVVVPEINAGSASLIASVINPIVGISTFLAQLILRSPLIEAATQEFFVDGTWVDPRVTKVEHKAAKP